MMTMMSESSRDPTLQVPPWSPFQDLNAAAVTLPVSGVTGGGGSDDSSPYLLGEATLAALQRYLPYNGAEDEEVAIEEAEEDLSASTDAYSCDEFRMYEFKVRRCARGRSHDWTVCPYAHPGEKARRRDPRKYHYSGTACPDFRKGSCNRGDACEFAHGVFECWLHPARYRTQPCKDGTACRRRVCFFAHTPEQLRVHPQQQQQQQPQRSPKTAASLAIESYDGSPLRQQAVESYMAAKNHQLRGQGHNHLSSSPTSTLIFPPLSPPSDSPPVSPSAVASPVAFSRSPRPAHSTAVNDIVASLRQLQLCKANSVPSYWAIQLGSSCFTGFASPRTAVGSPVSASIIEGFCSLPATPTRTSAATTAGGLGGWFDCLDGVTEQQEAPVERVESGRALRAKMFERLSKESIVETAEATSATPAPNVAWISDLVM